MRVGIMTDCYTPTKNGVVTSIIQLKEGLEQRGHHVVVVTVDTPHQEDGDASVYRFPSIPFRPDIEIRLGLVNPRTVYQIVRQERIDLIHTHTEFSVGWAGRLAAGKLGLPLVHTAHTMYQDYRHYVPGGELVPAAMIRGWLKLFLRNHNLLVCPSIKAQKHFQSFMPHARTVIIGNGVCPTRFRPDLLTDAEKAQARHTLGLSPSDKVILFVGRLAPEKRVVELLRALTPLLQTHPHVKAMFVGGGPSQNRMIRAAGGNDLRDQVLFPGYVEWEQMPRVYAMAGVFVTASLSEVHPITVIEAAMCGRPIVARRDDSYLDLVRDGYNGYLVDADSQIAARVWEILNDEAQWRAFSRNALALSAGFSVEVHVDRVESLYEQVLSGPLT
ncbi:MAG: glycosyltransferase [Chloroflexi bacterium]|nr:glycosyltransferase [Chloroflexota bacterium]MBU1750937.1 glycosyltransferase [Chloroflexota bacterium]